MNEENAQRKIRVDIARQELDLLDESGGLLARYPVSTSGFGLGCVEGSGCTPLGEFLIREKIGEGAAPGTVFVGRVPTGEVTGFATPEDERDLVVTRILWLDGIEEHNANTHERYIYIHGTNHEETIGVPRSHGCVRMRNLDVIELFDAVESGTPVTIA